MKTRHAHSLIEMLVVLIIVGVLIAVVVPAVQRARESARMADCIHRQGQLTKAVHMHIADEPYGRFPGFRAFAADGTTTIGWAPQVFEYLGRGDLDPTQATYIETLVCASDQGPKDNPRLNYVVNGGQAGVDSPADGIFFDHAKPPGERVYITKDDFADGLTNTIMLAENLDATEWTATEETSQCILWPLTSGNEVNNGTGARPSSHHPGGFVAAFADGSVKFMSETEINDDTDVHTNDSYYVALLTPGGDDTTGSGPGGGVDPSPGPGTEYCASTVGLVGHWTFDDVADPGRDISGNSHDGDLFGTPTFESTTDGGRVIVLDGVDDKVFVPYSADLNPGCMSITCWYRVADNRPFPNEEEGHGGIVVSRYHQQPYNGQLFGYVLYATPEGTSNLFSLWNGNGVVASNWHNYNAWGLDANQWTHAAAIFETTRTENGDLYIRKTLYKDGDHFGDVEDILYRPNSIQQLQFGASNRVSGNLDRYWYKGAIDDVRLYDRLLTESEVMQIKNEWAGQ